LNGTDQYTIFDLPIHVTNNIPKEGIRPSCDALDNPLIDEQALVASANNFTRIAGTAIQTGGTGEGLGKPKPDAQPKDGLGSAGALDWRTGIYCAWLAVFVFMLTL